MTTGIASGLGATWGLAQEGTVGTFQAPTRWLPFLSDKVKGSKKTVQSQALHGGLYELGSRRRLVFHEAKGAIELDVQDRQLGLILKNMLGGTPLVTQIGSTAAWIQTHTPGDLQGLSLSFQSGRPAVNGTITPFSYNGCKVTDWELSVAAAAIAKLAVTVDGWDESVSQTYTAPSFITSHPLAWVDATLLLGGTATTTAGITTVASGVAPLGTVKSVSIKGQNVVATDRQQIGSLVKREQLANNFRKYSGSIQVEFANLTDMYNAYYADTPLTLQLNMVGPLIPTSATNASLNVVIPQIYFNGEPPETDGPGILEVTVPFDVTDDGVDPAIQIQYTSADTAI